MAEIHETMVIGVVFDIKGGLDVSISCKWVCVIHDII